jgi:hypothetical protein
VTSPVPNPWRNIEAAQAIPYRCGYCDAKVASDKTYHVGNPSPNEISIRICPYCNRPTFFDRGRQYPGVAFGEAVKNLPATVEAVYNEARMSAAAGAYTSATLTTRKLLMHIAVAQGASTGLNFMENVEYLAANGFTPPNGGVWVDHIRKKGNEANHEIVVMSAADAEDLITFCEMLLKFIYEFPSRVPKP